MATLDIRPHSRRASVWAVCAMAVLAAAAFAEGLSHQLTQSGASPFPPPQFAGPSATVAVAAPAPSLQVARPEPIRHAEAPDVAPQAVDVTALIPDPVVAPPVVASDAAAVAAAPAPPPATPAPAPDEAPRD